MRNLTLYRQGSKKGWMLYLTHPSHILRRGSGHTTLTKTGTTPHLGCYPLLAVNPPFTMPHFCGLYDLARRLIVKNPEDVHADCMFAPLPAALRRKHFRVADLLY